MNRLIKYTLVSALALTATSLRAQDDISTQVNVKYDEAPQLMELNKLPLNPTLSAPTAGKSSLPYASRLSPVSLPNTIATLEPAAYGDTLYVSPFRGYAALGFMSKYNMAASAGYKVLDTDHTRLNAWMQYDGHAFRSTYNELISRYWRQNTGTIGVNLHQAAGRESFIDAGVDYTFSRYNYFNNSWDKEHQNVHRLNSSVLWTLNHRGSTYGIGAEYNHFAYTNNPDNTWIVNFRGKAQRENRVKAAAFASGQWLGAEKAGVDVQFAYLYYPNGQIEIYQESDDQRARRYTSLSHSLLTLHPHYQFRVGEQLELDLGAKVELTFNCGKAFHIAPAAQATWTPSSFVKVYAKAQGGEVQNTLASLYDVTPYIMPVLAYGNSHVPLDAEVGVTVGSWRGFFAQLSAGYAIANNWLMPNYNYAEGYYHMDLKGYKLGATVGYRYRDLFELKASYEAAPQRQDRGFYQWRDRAKNRVAVDFTVTPIHALDVNVGWEYRGGRCQYSYSTASSMVSSQLPIPVGHWISTSLGSINNLKAGALYRLTDRWSVFARGENLLNRHHLLIGGVPAQGITGLVGATYKF